MLPKRYQSFSVVYIHPRYPPLVGFALNTRSPGLPASDGVAMPIVNFLDTVASPCKKSEFDSTPLDDVEVSFSLKITGPSNSDTMLLSVPPSTLRDLLIDASSGVRTSNPILTPVASTSSPVTDGIGASNTSS